MKSQSTKKTVKIKKVENISDRIPTLQLKTEREIAMDFAEKVYQKFDKIIKSIILFGSAAKNQESADSDIDIVFPIMFKPDVENHITQYGNVQPSYYNAGIKFTKMMGERAQTINAVFLHPLDFVCWFKAANMINVANVDIKAMTRPEFHTLHQIMVSLPKMMIKDCVHRNNYHDYLK